MTILLTILSVILALYAVSILIALFLQSKAGLYDNVEPHKQMTMAIFWPLWLLEQARDQKAISPKDELQKLEDEFTM